MENNGCQHCTSVMRAKVLNSLPWYLSNIASIYRRFRSTQLSKYQRLYGQVWKVFASSWPTANTYGGPRDKSLALP
jgi:hypothetical protein